MQWGVVSTFACYNEQQRDELQHTWRGRVARDKVWDQGADWTVPSYPGWSTDHLQWVYCVSYLVVGWHTSHGPNDPSYWCVVRAAGLVA
jgi:hypothetical protein